MLLRIICAAFFLLIYFFKENFIHNKKNQQLLKLSVFSLAEKIEFINWTQNIFVTLSKNICMTGK